MFAAGFNFKTDVKSGHGWSVKDGGGRDLAERGLEFLGTASLRASSPFKPLRKVCLFRSQ